MSYVLLLVLALGAMLPGILQARHVYHTHETHGLSLTTEMCWLPSWGLWVLYACMISANAKIATDIGGLIASALVLGVLTLHLTRRRTISTKAVLISLSAASAGTLACLGALSLGGVAALAIAITLFDAVSLGPALAASVRSKSLAGVSCPAWLGRAAVAIGWITYAFAVDHPEAAGWYYVSLPASVFMLWRIWKDRRAAAAELELIRTWAETELVLCEKPDGIEVDVLSENTPVATPNKAEPGTPDATTTETNEPCDLDLELAIELALVRATETTTGIIALDQVGRSTVRGERT